MEVEVGRRRGRERGEALREERGEERREEVTEETSFYWHQGGFRKIIYEFLVVPIDINDCETAGIG